MASKCFLNPTLADKIVGDGWDSFHDLALKTYDVAITNMGKLANFTVAVPPNLSISYDLGGWQPGVFVAPDAPTASISAFTVPPLPADISVSVPSVVTAGPAPTEPETKIIYTVPGGAPGDFTVAAPDATLDLTFVDAPAAPVLVLPALPHFYDLNLPAPPTLTIPTFAGVRPDLNFSVPALTFAFTEQVYDSDLLEAVKARLLFQSQGGTGLPANIEQALFDNARRRIDGAIAASVQGVAEDFSNRGFAEPPPVMARRMREVRQAAQNETAQIGRDILLRATELERDQLNNFVVQGIALEQTLISAHLQREQRTFEAARYVMEATLKLFDAQVAKANVAATLYQAEAAAYRELIGAEIAKATVYKTQVDAQAAVGQVNEGLARTYAEQVRGVLAMVEIYKASIEAVHEQNAINTQKIEAKRTEITLFAEQAKAYETQWSGYGKKVDANLGILRGQELAVNAYGTTVSAWNTKNQVAIEVQRSELAVADLRVRKYVADLERFNKQLSAEAARTGSEVEVFKAETAVYSAAGQIASAASAAADRSFELHLTAAKTEAELLLAAGKENLNLAIEESRLVLEALRGITQTATQLASSMASAVNLSASISASDSNSHSCSENLTYTGEIADY